MSNRIYLIFFFNLELQPDALSISPEKQERLWATTSRGPNSLQLRITKYASDQN